MQPLSKQQYAKRRTLWPILMVIVILLALPGAALAQEPASPTTPAATTQADDGALEVGVEYITDYENCGGWGLGDLTQTAPDALGLRDRLTSPSFLGFFPYPTPAWSSSWTWGNTLAWQSDWTRAPAGSEEYYIDNVDFAYFSGHGASSGFFFGVGGNKRNGCQVTKAETAGAWGTRDNDWIGISACNVLDDPFSNFQGWANSINGTRLLMGFQTVMADVPFGDAVAWRLRWGNNFTQAWFGASDALLPNSQVARILAEDNAYFYDTWANHTSNTVVDNNFSWWTHRAGTAQSAAAADATTTTTAWGANKVNVNVLGGQMPVFQVAPLSLDAALGQFSQVGNAFGLTDTTPISNVTAADVFGPTAGENQLFASSNGNLLMDASGGNYLYINPDALWSQSAVQAATGPQAANVQAITGDQAIQIANNFLARTGLALADAGQPYVTSDVISSASEPNRYAVSAASPTAGAQVFADITANYKVNYDRILTFTPNVTATTAAGVNAVDFSVVGPGPKLAVYVAPTATAPAGAPQTSVLGGQGGWRQLQEPVNAASGQQLMTTMLTTPTIETLFTKAEQKVALDYVPLATVDKQIMGTSAGYYEGPIGMNLDHLIPVYILTVKGTLKEGGTQLYDVYIPVNEGDMRPWADILTPAATVVMPGVPVALSAADASKTLAELGVDPSLTFALGTGDPDSYIYEWFANEIAPANQIATGRSANVVIPASQIMQSDPTKPGTVKLILRVTDSLKNGDPRVSTDEVTLTFQPVYLPITRK